jgi:hypothetical protein
MAQDRNKFWAFVSRGTNPRGSINVEKLFDRLTHFSLLKKDSTASKDIIINL